MAAVRAADEFGHGSIRNFGPRDFAAPAEIRGVVQARDGRLFFAAQQSLLEYDGTEWRNHVAQPFVHALAIDRDDRVFVGSLDEIGYYERDRSGALAYHSLEAQLPPGLRPSGYARGLFVRDDGVYFGLEHGVARWSGGKFYGWNFGEGPMIRLVSDGKSLFVHRPGVGLLQLQQDQWAPVITTEAMRNVRTVALCSLGDDSVLIGIGDQGLFRWDGEHCVPWASAASDLLSGVTILSARRLDDGSIALGTMGSGLVVLSPDGSSARQYTVAHGLGDSVVTALFVDRDSGLWCGTNAGASRLDPNDAITIFDASNGLRQPIINGIWRHAGRLYVSTVDALLRLEPGDPVSGSAARFAPVPAVGPNPREMASDRDGLLIGTMAGLACLDRTDRLAMVLPLNEMVYLPLWSRHSPDSLLLGSHDGLVVAIHDPAGWRIAARFDGLGEIQSVAEGIDGAVWLGSPTRGFYRVARPAGDPDWAHADIRNYSETNHRLYQGHGWAEVYRTPGDPVFSTDKTWLRYRPASDDFVPDDRFQIEGRHVESVRPVEATPSGDLWVQGTNKPSITEYPLGRFHPHPDGTYEWQPAPHHLDALLGLSGAQVIYWEPDRHDGILWVKGIDSLLRIELSKLQRRSATWPVILKELRRDEFRTAVGPGATLPRLPWSPDAIRVSYALPRFDPGAGIQYETRLLGLSDRWSERSVQPESTFTNLSGGPFVFEVRAVDAEGATTPVSRFTFSVSPPWHRSSGALLGYAIAAIAGVFGLIRWRVQRAEREQRRLELVVAERTEELRVAKEQADAANQSKSAFLANMSHELRTPLNGVIGYAQVLMKDPEVSPRNRERLRIVQTSGEHLLRMINEVLDFSKIEAGRMELTTTPFHLPQLLRDIAAAASPRFDQKALDFIFDPAGDLPDLVLGDPLKLRQVLDNLLGNAAKFTPSGTVRFTARAVSPDAFELSVADTGVGISAADLARLFMPFQQAADGRPPEPGTGLGLAISQRIVGLMGGKLEVESRPGRGSRFFFVVKLPVIAENSEARRTTGSLITGYHGPRRKLLVVDDVATNRDVLRELLAPLGFEMHEAASGEAALWIVPQLEPAAVFLDLRMPGMDGLEVARRLRATEAGRRLKLFAMSASVLSFNREKAFAAGCDDFLPKPFREDDLLARLGLALQLEWIGNADVHGRRRDTASPFGATPTALDRATVAELLAITQRGEIAQLRARLDVLPADPLVEILDTLSRTYRMERIRGILEDQLVRFGAS